MGDDEVKRRILARRSVLVAAALASSTTACPKSEPCLSVAFVGDSGAGTMPTVCLSQVWIPPDAGVTSLDDAAAREGGIVLKPLEIVPDAGAPPPPPPVPCLSRPLTTATVTARPCLKMPAPKGE